MKWQKPSKEQLLLILIVLAALLLLTFPRSLVNVFMPNSQRHSSELATIDYLQGDVQIKRHKTLGKHQARPKSSLQQLDSIYTGNKSSVIISLKTQHQIRLGQNTQAVIEHREKHPERLQLTIINGDYKILRAGNESELEILDLVEGFRKFKIAPIQLSKSETESNNDKKNNSEDHDKKTQTTARKKETENQESEQDGPSSATITKVLFGQRSFFNRCYAQHLQKNPEAKGEIITTFVIEPDGDTKQVRILSSSLKDSELEKCIISVIERCPFPKFTGNALALTYPLSFY